jgi:hypothetical protein
MHDLNVEMLSFDGIVTNTNMSEMVPISTTWKLSQQHQYEKR